MRDLIRGSSLAHFVESVDQLGGNGYGVLAECTIDPDRAGSHEKFIRYTELSRAVYTASKRLGRDDFGLVLARAQRADVLGPVAVVARHADTVRDGLHAVAQYLHTYSPAVRASLRDDPESPQLRFEISLRSLVGREIMVELSMGIALELLRLLIGAQFVPTTTGFAHSQVCRTRAYTEVFGPSVEFEADGNFIDLPVDVLDTPTRGGDAVSRHLVEQYLSTIPASDSVVEQVADFVRRLLPLNQATLDTIAHAMVVHPRTLQRQLSAEGCTFSNILDNVRRETAPQLTERGLSAGQISAALGYSEQSCYTRACQRWFGENPATLAARLGPNPS